MDKEIVQKIKDYIKWLYDQNSFKEFIDFGNEPREEGYKDAYDEIIDELDRTGLKDLINKL